MTDSAVPSSSMQFPFPPLPTPLQDAATALASVSTGLARLGCDSLRQLAIRQFDHLRDLGSVSDLSGLLECQARFVQTLWEDQQQGLQQALRILSPGGGDAVRAAESAPAAKERPNAKEQPMAKRQPTANSQPAARAQPEPTQAAAAPQPARAAPREPVDSRDAAAATGSTGTRKTSGRKASARSRRGERGADPGADTASYELFVDKAGDHRFRLKGSDGTVLLISKPYKTRASAVNGIEVVRRNAANDDRYVTAEDTAGGPTFDLRAGNSRVISSSAPFPSAAKMKAAMAMVKRVAGSARIEPD